MKQAIQIRITMNFFKQQSAEMDKNKRLKMVWEMQQIIHDDAPYVIPYYPMAVQAYRTDRFTGWLDNQSKLAWKTYRLLS